MITLYWITVLGNISAFAPVTFSLFAVFLFFLYLDGFVRDATKSNKKKTFKLCYIGIVTSLALCVLVPSKNELYAIYRVGSVIDYVKNSKEVQKLPDNAVKALNIRLENVNKEKKDSTNNK